MIFRPLIDRFGAAELALALGIPTKNVHRWHDNDSIPATWFAAVARAGQRRAFADVTVEKLAMLAEERRLRRPAIIRPAA